ncbi:hypothetical protein ABG768_002297, partial [Culter alburnus]
SECLLSGQIRNQAPCLDLCQHSLPAPLSLDPDLRLNNSAITTDWIFETWDPVQIPQSPSGPTGTAAL